MMHKFYPDISSLQSVINPLTDLYNQTPTSKKFELLALGAATIATIYQCSSSPASLAGVAAWNLGTKLLMRHLSNNYFGHSRYEHILVKTCDVPVNVAVTTFLSSGISPYLTSFELGIKFSQALAYGVIGQLIKDFSSSLVNNLNPATDKQDAPIPAGRHTIDCFKYFLVQLIKFTFSPLKFTSWHNVLEQSLAGFLRNLSNEFFSGKNPFQSGDINPLIMGGITHSTYMVIPKLFFSSYTFIPKCAFSIVVDSLERISYHATDNQPFVSLAKKQEKPEGKTL